MAYALKQVRVNVNVVRAPQPPTLQQSGFLISLGGSILSDNQYQYCGDQQEVINLLSGTGNSVELEKMGSNFFKQGKGVGVYVLELGTIATPSEQMRALYSFLILNTDIFYSCTTPVSWDGTTEDVVESVSMTNIGSGYALAPTATVPPPPGGEAAIIIPIVDLLTGEITGYMIEDGSFGYVQAPVVTVSAPFTGGTQATAIAEIDGNGAIISVIPVNNGSDYVSIPNVVFSAPVSGTTATGTAIVNSLGQVYRILIDNSGDGYAGVIPTITIDAPPTGGTQATAVAILNYPLTTLISNFSANNSRFYFFVTTTVSNLADYVNLKACFAVVPYTTIPSTEFQASTMMAVWLSNKPAANNILAPMNQKPLVGVTPYPQNNNTNSDINYIIGLGGNIVDTGAQGGIPYTLIAQGYLMNGMQSNWWFGVDWFLINVERALSAAIIQGSVTNPPLLYDTMGIRKLTAVAQGVADAALNIGCLNDAQISYIPFQEYVTANPGDYANGAYNGLSGKIVGKNGFITLTFYVTAFESFIPEEGAVVQINRKSPMAFNASALRKSSIITLGGK